MKTNKYGRDDRTGALVSNDLAALKARQKELEMHRKMNAMEDKMKAMEGKVDETLDAVKMILATLHK